MIHGEAAKRLRSVGLRDYKCWFQFGSRKRRHRKTYILRKDCMTRAWIERKEYDMKAETFLRTIIKFVFNFDNEKKFEYVTYKSLKCKTGQSASAHFMHKVFFCHFINFKFLKVSYSNCPSWKIKNLNILEEILQLLLLLLFILFWHVSWKLHSKYWFSYTVCFLKDFENIFDTPECMNVSRTW